MMARLALRIALAKLPFWDEIGSLPPRRVPLPLRWRWGRVPCGLFRAFLGRTAADFAIFGGGDPPEPRPWWPPEPSGILHQAERSIALWSRGEVLAYDVASAMRTLAQAWTSYGLTGLAEFAL